MNSITLTAIKKSFLITLAYVGAGTLTLLIMCSGTGDLGDFINGLLTIILLVTMPVTCISFGIVYSNSHAIGSVLLVQSAMFILCWVILYYWFSQKMKGSESDLAN
jgi:ABC-type spermidine/putrescine transport system permease subunit II